MIGGSEESRPHSKSGPRLAPTRLFAAFDSYSQITRVPYGLTQAVITILTQVPAIRAPLFPEPTALLPAYVARAGWL